jgi:hypothetical protein|nr:hypothetical protein [Kofleriaceae bacterium]
MAATARTRELETLLARIRNAGNVQLNYEMWSDRGRQFAAADECARMDGELAAATRDQADARAALTALVASSSADDVAAWAGAHDAYLAAFLAGSARDGTAFDVATKERAAWADVRAGKLPFVDENLFYVTLDADRYRALFGIDPNTLEPVTAAEPA